MVASNCPWVWTSKEAVCLVFEKVNTGGVPLSVFELATATYAAEFVISADFSAKNLIFTLDLGRVKNIARVKVNGRDLGVNWKPPFRFDITAIVAPGINKAEIEVTNLWHNRLIGDELAPDDCEWGPIQKFSTSGPPDSIGRHILRIPEWLLNSEIQRKSGRITFSSFKFVTSTSQLIESGLMGPVTIEVAIAVPLKDRANKF